MLKIPMGLVDEINRTVLSRVGKVDWAKINTQIRRIPIEFEELLEIRRNALPIVLAARQNRSQDAGRGSRPRVEGELAALTIIAKRRFNEMFKLVGERTYRMRMR